MAKFVARSTATTATSLSIARGGNLDQIPAPARDPNRTTLLGFLLVPGFQNVIDMGDDVDARQRRRFMDVTWAWSAASRSSHRLPRSAIHETASVNGRGEI